MFYILHENTFTLHYIDSPLLHGSHVKSRHYTIEKQLQQPLRIKHILAKVLTCCSMNIYKPIS